MHPSKADLISQYRGKAKLAEATNCSRAHIHDIIRGRRVAAKDLAITLAIKANEVFNVNFFEPNDFNPELSTALRNLQPDVKFLITYLDSKTAQSMTAEELQADNPDDLELLTALHECVWDGQRQLIHQGSTLIELDDQDPDLVDVD